MNGDDSIIVAADLGITIQSFSDISNLLGACLGSQGLILTEDDVSRAFFDLQSGLAGELFQKFANYRIRLALVVPDPQAYGDRFSELAYEHATDSMIRIVRSQEEASTWLHD
ncbi:MAG: DUF4180 domain-containing protein [Chloroflexota bacterium]